tara:strand:+ start:137 stop:406 length:270 start_codon:yes stop_codon:yes gene_type:complete
MIVVMRQKSNGRHVQRVAEIARQQGFDALVGIKQGQRVVVILGSGLSTLSLRHFSSLSGVAKVYREDNPLGDDFDTFEPILVPVERSVT